MPATAPPSTSMCAMNSEPRTAVWRQLLEPGGHRPGGPGQPGRWAAMIGGTVSALDRQEEQEDI